MNRDVIIYNLHQMIDYLQSAGNPSSANEYQTLLELVERGEEIPSSAREKLASVSGDPEELAEQLAIMNSDLTVPDLINHATQLMDAYGYYQPKQRTAMKKVIDFLASRRSNSIDEILGEKDLPSAIRDHLGELIVSPGKLTAEINQIKEDNMGIVLRVIYGGSSNIEEYQEVNKLTSLESIWDHLTRDQKLRYYYFEQINAPFRPGEMAMVKSLLTKWFADHGIISRTYGNLTGVPFFVINLPPNADLEAIKEWITASGKLVVDLPPSSDVTIKWGGIISIDPSVNPRIVRLSQ